MESFADWLYRTRMRRGKFISQQVLALRSGYSRTYISYLETGYYQPSNRCRQAIKEALNKGLKALKRDR